MVSHPYEVKYTIFISFEYVYNSSCLLPVSLESFIICMEWSPTSYNRLLPYHLEWSKTRVVRGLCHVHRNEIHFA